MVDMSQYKKPVRRSLLQREMIGGIPQLGMLLLFIFGLVFLYGLKLYALLPFIILAYLFMRHLTKKDQWQIDIVFNNITQKDRLIP